MGSYEFHNWTPSWYSFVGRHSGYPFLCLDIYLKCGQIITITLKINYMSELEIFINFLNWALPALGVIAFMVGIPVLIIWYIFIGRKKHNGMWILKRIVLFTLCFLGIFVVYGLLQLLGALFGVETNRTNQVNTYQTQ